MVSNDMQDNWQQHPNQKGKKKKEKIKKLVTRTADDIKNAELGTDPTCH